MNANAKWSVFRGRVAGSPWTLPLLIAVAVASGAAVGQQQNDTDTPCSEETANLANAIVVLEFTQSSPGNGIPNLTQAANDQARDATNAFLSCRLSI